MSVEDLLKKNKEWARQINDSDPDFFNKLVGIQKPKYLWIGCSDSRVPANQITGTLPGEVFVHRNIANVVVHTDMNVLSVIQYAVEVLDIQDIIVCGHYSCGGVMAAMSGQSFGMIDNWLCHLKDVYIKFRNELDAIKDEEERARRFVEHHVCEQVNNVMASTIIQNAKRNGRQVRIHGWVYDLHNGLLKDLVCGIP